MQAILSEEKNSSQKVKPLCPVFGQCGGCSYQDISYSQELKTKEEMLKNVLRRIKRPIKIDLIGNFSMATITINHASTVTV